MSEDRAAIFSAVICSQVWFASDGGSSAIYGGFSWLAFAVVMLYASQRAPGQEPQP
jgi:hypothetical protein